MGYWDYEPCELLHCSLKVSTLGFNICFSLGEFRSRAGVREGRLSCLNTGWSVLLRVPEPKWCKQRECLTAAVCFLCLPVSGIAIASWTQM